MTRRLVTMAVAMTLCAGCRSRPTQLVGAATQPANLYWIGPQPGPDHATVPAVNPYAGDRTALTEGRRLFTWMNCSGCHGDHGGGGMGPSLRDSLWYYGGTDDKIFASITQGRDRGMPAWGSKLSQDQIWKLVSYIKSMRTRDEPEPPH